ncbi:MAG TPA: hypothetical protein DCM87_14560 [Planctomycetes bacterium]|jgi:chromosome segregation ATPase|nr:hypothetical protein [Planctomycetota bacterium]
MELVCIVAGGLAALLILREILPSWRVSRELRVQTERLDALQGDVEKNAEAGARHETELAAHARKLAEHDAAIARNAEAVQGVRGEVKRLEERTAKDVGELRELYKKSQRDTELLTEEVLELKRARREIEKLLDAVEKRLNAPQVNPGEIQ